MLQYVRANVLLLCLVLLSYVIIIANIMIFWKCNIYSEDILYLPSVICRLLSVICTGFFPEVLQLASFPALAHWCVDARLDIYTSHVTQYLSIHDIGLWRGRMRKIRQNNRLTFQPADSILFLDRIKLHQKQHQCSDGCREEGEQRPDHPVHCVGIGDGHYRLAIDVGS